MRILGIWQKAFGWRDEKAARSSLPQSLDRGRHLERSTSRPVKACLLGTCAVGLPSSSALASGDEDARREPAKRSYQSPGRITGSLPKT